MTGAAKGSLLQRFVQPERWGRPLAFGLTALLLVLVALVAILRWRAFAEVDAIGIDYRTFVEAGRRVVEDGTPYLDYQLMGPYVAQPLETRAPADVPYLYPPPFAFVNLALLVLPWMLWWAIPLGLLAFVIAGWHPASWSWPVMAALACWPATASVVIVGGSTMWVVALVAAGLRWGWPSAFIVLKPTFLPFTLIGVRTRGWWLGLGVVTVASLLVLPLWSQWRVAIQNVTDAQLAYSLGDLPFIAIPVVAWLARQRPTWAPPVAATQHA